MSVVDPPERGGSSVGDMNPVRTTGCAVVRRSNRTTIVGLLAAALLIPSMIVIGCSSPTGDLAGAPQPSGGRATGPMDVRGTSTIQSYEIRGKDAELAIRSYERSAVDAGWVTTVAPERTGRTAWSLTMTRGGSTLEVTTSPFDGDAGSQADVVELSLQVTGSS